MKKPDHAGVYIPPPLIYVAGFAAGKFLERFFRLRLPLNEPFLDVLGGVVMLCGIGIATAPFADFVRKRTAIVPIRPATTLVVSGAYRFTRNPMYVGLAAIYIGVCLVFEAPGSLLLLPLVLLVIDRYVVRREEAYLERRFGAEYLEYKSRVRRWV